MIEIEIKRVDGAIRFSVEDEGTGIAATEREKVFKKFHRADKNTKGFRMNLAIVRGIVRGARRVNLD